MGSMKADEFHEEEPLADQTTELDEIAGEQAADEGVPPHIEENVDILKAYEDADLLATLKAALEDRAAVLQALVDWAVPDRTYVSSRLLVDNRVCGRIKSYNEASGYGFIDCPAVHEAFGNDAFLHHQQLGGFSVGQEVSFAILLSKEGKPQAFDLGAAKNGVDLRGKPGKGGDGGWRAGGCKGGGKGGDGGYGSQRGPYDPYDYYDYKGGPGWGPPPGPPGGRQWQDGGWGRPLPSPPPPPSQGKGPPAAFARLQLGRPALRDGPAEGRARQAEPAARPGAGGGRAPPSSADVPGITDRRFLGVVKSFNERNGFGFIENEELKSRYGNDVFVHYSQMGHYRVGEAVSFGVFLNRDEKPQAKELRPVNGRDLDAGSNRAGPPYKRPRIA